MVAGGGHAMLVPCFVWVDGLLVSSAEAVRGLLYGFMLGMGGYKAGECRCFCIEVSFIITSIKRRRQTLLQSTIYHLLK